MIASIEFTSAGFAPAAAGVSLVAGFCIGDGAGDGAGFSFWAIATAPHMIARVIKDLTASEISFIRDSTSNENHRQD
jgi:hypothetical protein